MPVLLLILLYVHPQAPGSTPRSRSTSPCSWTQPWQSTTGECSVASNQCHTQYYTYIDMTIITIPNTLMTLIYYAMLCYLFSACWVLRAGSGTGTGPSGTSGSSRVCPTARAWSTARDTISMECPSPGKAILAHNAASSRKKYN